MKLDIVTGAGLAQVKALYESAGYGGGVAAADLVLGAGIDGRLAGVVRLCPEEGVIVLRGMQVDAAVQRQGIGRALLARCVPHLDAGEAWCLPYAHLENFYGQAGFLLAPPETLPSFLAQRLARYLAAGQQVVAMRRLPPGTARARKNPRPEMRQKIERGVP